MNKKKGYEKITEDLRKLRFLLPLDYMDRITQKFGVSRTTVTNALLGRTRRFDIIQYAIELAEENKRIAQRLNEVVNQSN